MASKRKPVHNNIPTQMKFRPRGMEQPRSDSKGTRTRPSAAPTSVNEVLTKMVLYVSKKPIFFDTNIKVALYLGGLFLISLIGDFIPLPKSYFSRSDNLINVYFVKMGWTWTILFSLPFLSMTSYTICCGNIQRLMKNHFPRIVIATIFCIIWIKTFNMIETTFGRCNVRGFDSKSSCLKCGNFWNGFELSGHAFILIYASLVLIEEARPIINWDNIREHLRQEEFNRASQDSAAQRINPLKNLKDEEIRNLKYLYERFTPTIRLFFVGMTVLQLLWDVMLVCTMLYFHHMAEKVLSGMVAILTWYFTYRFWYPSQAILPDVAGKGVFQYQKHIKVAQIPLRRNPSLINNTSKTQPNIPKFMSMPLYTQMPQNNPSTSAASDPTVTENYLILVVLNILRV